VVRRGRICKPQGFSGQFFASAQAGSLTGTASFPAASIPPYGCGPAAPPVWPDLSCDKLTTNMSHKHWHDWASPDIGYITVCPGPTILPD
jgi:hypothetical protein